MVSPGTGNYVREKLCLDIDFFFFFLEGDHEFEFKLTELENIAALIFTIPAQRKQQYERIAVSSAAAAGGIVGS